MADFMNDSLEEMLWQGNSIKGCYEGILLHKFVKSSETYQSNILTMPACECTFKHLGSEKWTYLLKNNMPFKNFFNIF